MTTACFNEAAGIHRRKPAAVDLDRARVDAASMRPPEFTGGNSTRCRSAVRGRPRFNEAAGIHRRKQTAKQLLIRKIECRFNEAAGIHRRKPRPPTAATSPPRSASMRPPEFTGGNSFLPITLIDERMWASMRPPEFTGGNPHHKCTSRSHRNASMRPPEFTGGNPYLY